MLKLKIKDKFKFKFKIGIKKLLIAVFTLGIIIKELVL